MDLSPTAVAYLATLRRYPAVPLQQVAEALKRQNYPVFESWLEFHERFAGYEEIIGRDTAIWGIVHAEPRWAFAPYQAWVQARGSDWCVACADVYPQYDYNLNSAGEFVSYGGGGEHESFSRRVERGALGWHAAAGGRKWRQDCNLRDKVKDNVESFLQWTDARIVVEASDKYVTSWRGHDAIVFRNELPHSKESWRLQVWVADDAREKMIAYRPDPL
jgi:hypothetical protein